ncbi:MAG: hypothetical protein KAH20_11205 [Methylococcales bacterium]|nr:hypothetical protein [Methylococcales bacterium]
MKKINFLLACIIALVVGCYTQTQHPPSEVIEVSEVDLINKEISSNPSAGGRRDRRRGNSFYVDPINGSMDNPGSSDFPWKTLEEVVKNNLIETKDKNGNIINQGSPIHSGDTIVLRSGFHGHVQIKNAFNDRKITVISENGEDPKLAELELISVKNWKFSGLTISPEFSNKAIRTNYIVVLGDNGNQGPTSNVELVNSHIFTSSTPPETLSSGDWKLAKIGVLLGRKATNLRVRNNYIQTTEFGISAAAPGSIVEGNVVTDFSKDGIRLISSNTIVKYNVIKNNYVVNVNHDDGIQGFSYNGVDLTDSSVVGNIILNRDKKGNPYPGELQGIGFFDGPFYDFLLQDNVVMSFTWHGLAIYDSVGGKIQSNFLYTPDEIGNNIGARITLGTKNKGVDIINLLAGNIAHHYLFEESELSKNVLNLDIDDMSEDSQILFMKRLNSMLGFINATYGEVHNKSTKKRINEEFMLNGPSYLFN